MEKSDACSVTFLILKLFAAFLYRWFVSGSQFSFEFVSYHVFHKCFYQAKWAFSNI